MADKTSYEEERSAIKCGGERLIEKGGIRKISMMLTKRDHIKRK